MKRILLILFTCLFVFNLFGRDSISTRYADGEFVSYCSVETNASLAVADEVVDDLIDQFRGNPEQLFEWAFKGLGKQTGDDSKNEVLLDLKLATFDKMTGKSHLLTDIVVPGFRTYKDVSIDSRVTKTKLKNGGTRVFVDIFYSNLLLKKAYGTFFVTPIADNKVMLSMRIHVRFGWFFNIFITQRRYRNVVEWRMQGFMNNMRDESERRAKFNGK
ncbi:MAG TPA: hypothetical protein PLJ40_00030 [Paludibacteraceae bacterium]|nr:hypothetical protein [Paludibacteraceae bacterium]HQB68488.1 hypothetical protein [Paludibacteraceae bacterium]HRS66989.1 hypothetical protein [Paludibacteraceae bacterium]